MKPDSTPPSANGTENPRKRMPASSTLTPRTSSSAVGTSTITTPEPQFDSVAVCGAEPERAGPRDAGRRRAAPDRARAARRPRGARRRRGCPPMVAALSQPAAAACWIAAHADPMPNISSTRVTTGTERVRSAGRCGTSHTQQHERDRQQHHVHAEERAPRPDVGEHAGDQRAASRRRCRRAHPRCRPPSAASRRPRTARRWRRATW